MNIKSLKLSSLTGASKGANTEPLALVKKNQSVCSGGAASPDDFVAGTTYGGPPAVFRRLLRSLQDGTAALHRRGLGWLLVLGHDGADLVWAKAVGKIGVRDPRRSAGRSRTLWCGGGT